MLFYAKKKDKIFERWGLRLQTPILAPPPPPPPPLQISGYAPAF